MNGNNNFANFYNDYDQEIGLDCSSNYIMFGQLTDMYVTELVALDTQNHNYGFTGPGFEYYPQDSVVAPYVGEDTSCHGNCVRPGQMMYSNNTVYTQSIARVYNEQKLHCYTAVFRNTDAHGMDQTDQNQVVPGLIPETCAFNCTMAVTNFSGFYNENWTPIVHLRSKDGLQLAGFYLVLKFPNTVHIAEDIVRCVNNCILFKIDVARAFCNLRVDPVDSLKFGIKWNGGYYADLVMAFGWMHGSMAFQILSDASVFIVAKANIKIHCYIDDCIAVLPKAKAEEKFQFVCDLMNWDFPSIITKSPPY